jgi:hypothetical protein
MQVVLKWLPPSSPIRSHPGQKALSAGTRPGDRVHPEVMQVMKEVVLI